MERPELVGWVELDGRRLSGDEVAAICRQRPEEILRFGGEFFLEYSGCQGPGSFRDHAGELPERDRYLRQRGYGALSNRPYTDMPLEEAIITAVRLRSDEGITALSGGVDSTLVAQLAQRECVAVGLEGSHDLRQARHAADTLGLTCTAVTITPDEIADALPAVLRAIPKKDPLNTGIALTQYFIARSAAETGIPAHHHRTGCRRALRGIFTVPRNDHA